MARRPKQNGQESTIAFPVALLAIVFSILLILLLLVSLHLPILLKYDDLPVHNLPQHAHALSGKLQARVGDLDLGQRIFPAM
ncbi:hypothetical protein A2U01_0081185, partial [Trifolium medium]|nr:hypothetical protein [Trifolium medium]